MRRVSLLLLAISVSLAGCGGGGSTSSAVPQTSQAPQMPALGSSSNLALALSGQSGTQSGWGGPAKITINLASPIVIDGTVYWNGVAVSSSSRSTESATPAPSPTPIQIPAAGIVVTATNSKGAQITWTISNWTGAFKLSLPSGLITITAYVPL